MTDSQLQSRFPDVPARVRPDTCIRCHIVFSVGDRVTQILIVAGIGPHPSGLSRVPFLCDVPEFGHLRCKDRMLQAANTSLILPPRNTLKPTNNSRALRPRVPEYLCALCKKPLEREDRVLAVVPVRGIGIDPDTNQPAAECSDEYEIVHFDCSDPKLTIGGSLVLS